MKYIRTKDEIRLFGGTHHNGDVVIGKKQEIDFGYCFDKKDIIKQADTIEELVDGFWWENDFYKDPIFMPNYYIVLERVKAWKESDEELLANEFARISIYASVYVKGKGWVHVAKMNDKGELELL